MTDGEASRAERKLLPDNLTDDVLEARKDRVAEHVMTALSEKFLNGNERQSGYAAEAFFLRKSIGEKLKSSTVDKESIVSLAERAAMVEKRKQILNERLTADDLDHITQLNALFAEQPQILTSVRNALLEFQYKRLDMLHIETDQIRQNLDHIQRVVGHVDRANKRTGNLGLGILAATVHDIEKISNYKYLMHKEPLRAGTTTLLAEHEVMSAVLGQEVVREALKAAGLEAHADAAAKLIGKTILPHGEGEWPERQAEMGKLPATMSLDENGEYYLLLGGLFIKSPRSSEIPIVDEDLLSERSPETRTAEAMCRSTIEAVSAADKMDGLGDLSLVKYHQGNSIPYIFSRPTSYEYAKTFSETLVYNMRNAPDTAGIKHDQAVRALVDRTGLLYSILEDVQSHPTLSELSIAAGHDVPDFLPPYSDVLGSDAAKSLMITAIEMREIFQRAKEEWDHDTEQARNIPDEQISSAKYIQREKRAIKAKRAYGEKLEKLLSDILSLGTLDLNNSLGTKVKGTLNTLEQLYP